MFLLHGRPVSRTSFRAAWLQEQIDSLCDERDEAEMVLAKEPEYHQPGDKRDTATELLKLNDEMIHLIENWLEREQAAQ